MDRNKISTEAFYNEYHGHKTSDLKKIHKILENIRDNQKFIYFCGDSTLDNKHWFNDTAAAVNGYETALDSPWVPISAPISAPRSRCDVAYWVNKFAEENREKKENREKYENFDKLMNIDENRETTFNSFLKENLTNEENQEKS